VTWWWLAIISSAIVLAALTRWLRHTAPEDLGTVSQQWLAEQRFTERHYPGR
jgi:hypothetical protein